LTAQEIRMAPKGLLTVAGSIDIDQFWPATKDRVPPMPTPCT
jgi:hypothetical protein